MIVAILESSFNRVKNYIASGKRYGIISASRSNLSNKENLARTKELGKDLRAHGLGYHKIMGRSKEVHDGKPVHATEMSMFVPKAKKHVMVKLAKKYGQYSVIHGKSQKSRLVRTEKGNKNIGKKEHPKFGPLKKGPAM